MKIIYIFAFVLIVNLGCSQINSKPITEVSQNELKNVVLVDVRTPEEFSEGHLSDALNIDWLGSEFVKNFETIDKDETIYVYCKMGGRSAKAQAKLEELGYSHVVNLEGGYDAWKAKNP